MKLNEGTTLKSVEKLFGPALSGKGEPDKTVSAVRYAKGKGAKFAGVSGIVPDAAFYVHFPLRVDLGSVRSTKGAIDHIKDLKEDGVQAAQGRQADVETFLDKLKTQKEVEVRKSEAAREKAAKQKALQEQKAKEALEKAEIKRKKEAEKAAKKKAIQDEKAALLKLVGEKRVVLEIDGNRIEATAKVTYSKKNKKFTAKLEWV